MHNDILFLLIASLWGAFPVSGLYTENSPVLQVDHQSYNRLIAQSNHTSILEFYAPWCGHCQNLMPAYEKAARNLQGLAKVAAVNCDADENKPFCHQMGVTGYPTLKLIIPSKKAGKPRIEDYKGARNTKAIVDAVVENIPNHVKRLKDEDLDGWLSQNKETPKAILFTEKGTTSALLRALAVDFLGVVKFGQIRNKESGAVDKFNIDTFPTLILIPDSETEHILYEGELKKQPILEFLSQVAEPNPDPAPVARKSKSSKSSTAVSSSVVTEDSKPTETPDSQSPPDQKPVRIATETPRIAELSTPEALALACLTPKSSTCVLALLPASDPDAELFGPAKEALSSLSEIAHKLSQHRKGKGFPIYSLPSVNSGAEALRTRLGLSQEGETEIVAVNRRRNWWKRYEPTEKDDFKLAKVEDWVDGIRLGEGPKNKLPEDFIVEEEALESDASNEAAPEASAGATETEIPEGETAEATTEETIPEATEEVASDEVLEHDEL